MSPTQTDPLARLQAAGLIAVIRSGRPEHTVRVAGTLLEGSISAIERTFTTPGAADALTQVRKAHGSTLLLGAGTLRGTEHVAADIDAEVDFLGTARLRLDILGAMPAGDLQLPSIFTPAEVAGEARRGVS